MQTDNGFVVGFGLGEALYGLWRDRATAEGNVSQYVVNMEYGWGQWGTMGGNGGDGLVSLYSALSCRAMGTGSHVPASLMVSGGPEMSKCFLTQFVSSFSAAALAVGNAAFHIVVSDTEPVS